MVLPPSSSTMPPPITPDPRFPLVVSTRRWSRQSDTTMSCTINIFKQNDNIQQMRIDFIDLELRGPTNGVCTIERLVISGQNINDPVPEICGYNTGQHGRENIQNLTTNIQRVPFCVLVYVDVSTLMGPLQLSVLSATGERKRFKIRVCQIANDCTNSNNCLQYYTGVTGMISSFNYDQAALNNRSEPGYFVSNKP